jgi:hypothetical protein
LSELTGDLLMEAVGVPSSVNRTQGERKLALRTLGVLLWRLRRFQHNVRDSVCSTELMGQGAGDVTVAGCVWVYLLHHRLGDLGASRGVRTVTHADPRGTAAALALGHDLYLVRDRILSAFIVGVRARNLAVAGLVVHAFHTGDGDRRRGSRSVELSRAAFRGVREVFVTGRLGGFTLVRHM